MSQVERKECPICCEEANCREEYQKKIDEIYYECKRCGRFQTDRHFEMYSMRELDGRYEGDEPFLGVKGSRERSDFSAWMRSKNRELPRGRIYFHPIGGNIFYKGENDDNLKSFNTARSRIRTFHNRADEFLLFLEKESLGAGQGVDARNRKKEFEARAWALNLPEFQEIVSFLIGQKRIRFWPKKENNWLGKNAEDIERTIGRVDPYGIAITPGGWAYLEELKKTNAASDQAFVAMWFPGEETEPEWHQRMERAYADSIYPAIREAWYLPIRIDKKPHTNNIVHEIITEIKKSRFVVADLTGLRGGVYFEAGYAHGLNLPVFFTCHTEYFKDRHFDVNQYICQEWKDEDIESGYLKDHLTNWIEALIGRGPVPPTDSDSS